MLGGRDWREGRVENAQERQESARNGDRDRQQEGGKEARSVPSPPVLPWDPAKC